MAADEFGKEVLGGKEMQKSWSSYDDQKGGS